MSMNYKILVKRFSYTGILKEMNNHNWRLPTCDEAKTILGFMDTKESFWVVNEATDPNRSSIITSEGKLSDLNSNWIIKTIVIKPHDVCLNCRYMDITRKICTSDRFPVIDAYIQNPDEFGCNCIEIGEY